MIAPSPTHASARRQAHRHALRRLAPLALTLAVVLGVPSLAEAGSGGVSLGSAPTKTSKAKSASADDDQPGDPVSVSKIQLRRAQLLLRLSPSGTHDAKTRRAVKRFQQLRGITPSGVIDLATYIQIKNAFALLETGGIGVEVAVDPNATGGAAPTDPVVPPLVLPANLAPITPQEREILGRVAQCESQGNAGSVSTNGIYRGKYQFDRTTWKTVGGTGDPAAATEEEQDQRAAILLRQRGTTPWPICSVA